MLDILSIHKLVGKKREVVEDKTVKNILCDMAKMMTTMMMVMTIRISQDLQVNYFFSSVTSLPSFLTLVGQRKMNF